MNNSQKTTSKAIALFLSLGMMSSLVGCEIGGAAGEGGEGGEDGAGTEQTAPTPDEGGEGGKGS
ncbi:MAG: hypothetical protein HC939_08810 [Pleurocapsa sp. SU_5_0]|nr:hypothetical protein [Pleurocapsa sp. SU_5_0]NJO98612.1 hypothetical protein [Pleurocapsa sp. CRU_1_2]NJR46651.1 hypothetical protein [Hyellaceae cyanobacterium CSU_1_1]